MAALPCPLSGSINGPEQGRPGSQPGEATEARRWYSSAVSSRFTEFVRSLGEETDRELFTAVWSELRALLRNELKKRSLWDSPPSYLGVHGWTHWEAPAAEGPARRVREDALGELVAECFPFIFVTRIRGLKAQLKIKPNLDGLILLNVRHFLHERQKEHDPLGFRVFEVVHAAVCQAMARGELQVLAGDPKVRNDTLLGFDPARELPAFPPEVDSLVARWNDDLMPALIMAKGADKEEVCARLCAHLLELPQHGIQCFRFKDLVDPFKFNARARWAGLLETESEHQDWRQTLLWMLPATDVESQQNLEQLTCRVSAAIETLEVELRTKTALLTLWSELRRYAEARVETAAEEEEVLSQRKLALRLGIRRARLPELFGILRQLVIRCRDQEWSRPPLWATGEGQDKVESCDR